MPDKFAFLSWPECRPVNSVVREGAETLRKEEGVSQLNIETMRDKKQQ